jgi:sec-independent protein translocase protein TatB
MFGVDSGELFIIVLVAVVVIGPKELPRVMRTVGHWVGRARSMANQFRSGVDQMVRDSEIADLEQKWREQNEAIMKANPFAPPESDWGLPPPPPQLSPEAPSPESSTPVSLDKPAEPPVAQTPAPPPTPAVALHKVVQPADPAAPGSARRKPVAPALVKPAPRAPREPGAA